MQAGAPNDHGATYAHNVNESAYLQHLKTLKLGVRQLKRVRVVRHICHQLLQVHKLLLPNGEGRHGGSHLQNLIKQQGSTVNPQSAPCAHVAHPAVRAHV